MRFLTLSFLSLSFLLISVSSTFATTSLPDEASGSTIPQLVPDMQLIIDGVEILLPYEEYRTWFESAPLLTYAESEGSHDILNDTYCPGPHVPCSLRRSIRDLHRMTKMEQRSVDEARVTDYLATLSKEVLRAPVNAVLDAEDGVIIVAEKERDGLVLSPEANIPLLMAAIENATQDPVFLDVSRKPATVTAANFRDTLGLREVIGEGRSNFAGSPANRIHNIQVAAAQYDNMIIAPDEEFSFVANLGPVDASTGYKKELVIKNNQTIPEYGGGVCQVSTTIFRGAIFTGMEITERRNHSYPVKYYEPVGFDATIYLPAPDIKFKNNTAHHIMISADIEGDELVFTYYGTKDGREVVMDGPHITDRQPDGAMKAHFTQKVVSATGEPLIEKTFYSNYRSPEDFPQVDVSIGDGTITSKPEDWSKKQWKSYQQAHGL